MEKRALHSQVNVSFDIKATAASMRQKAAWRKFWRTLLADKITAPATVSGGTEAGEGGEVP